MSADALVVQANVPASSQRVQVYVRRCELDQLAGCSSDWLHDLDSEVVALLRERELGAAA